MCQVFVLLFYGHAIFNVFSLCFGRWAFRLRETTNQVYPGKVFLTFLFYDQVVSSVLQGKSPYVLLKWNDCVCLLPGSSLFKIIQPTAQGLTEEQCSTAPQEECSKKNPGSYNSLIRWRYQTTSDVNNNKNTLACYVQLLAGLEGF